MELKYTSLHVLKKRFRAQARNILLIIAGMLSFSQHAASQDDSYDLSDEVSDQAIHEDEGSHDQGPNVARRCPAGQYECSLPGFQFFGEVDFLVDGIWYACYSRFNGGRCNVFTGCGTPFGWNGPTPIGSDGRDCTVLGPDDPGHNLPPPSRPRPIVIPSSVDTTQNLD